MRRKRVTIPGHIKLKYARMCIEYKMSKAEAARQLGVSDSDVLGWVYRYREWGTAAFLDTGMKKVYAPELKLKAVQSYLKGEGSLRYVAAKYGVRNAEQLHRWIMMYNNGEDFLLRKITGGSRMSASRKTTKEERVTIARECLENGGNYTETARRHNLSYQQVYSWVKRYRELGEAGLEDRRGKRKADQEPRSEIEKLQIEMAQLKRELYMTRMERDLLKKVRELERKDLYRK